MKSLKLLRKKFELLKQNVTIIANNIKNKTTRENYKFIEKVVTAEVVILEWKIKSRQVRKISSDNIRPTKSVRQRKRTFKKDVIVNKRKEKHKRYRCKKNQSNKEIKQNAPNQNAINLFNTVLSVLSEEEKSLLNKGPCFVPIPTDINWYEVRKDFTKFINKIRYLADLDQQQEQIHPQVNSNEPTINENNIPPDKSPP